MGLGTACFPFLIPSHKKCMVYFANKTRNHAKSFRIQKHLLPANESCVLVLQNCCATDFRKTVIRFVARQVPRRIPPRKFGVPGRLAPFQSLSRRIPPTEHADAPHPPQNIAALEPKPRRRATGQRIQQTFFAPLAPHKSRLSAKRPPDLLKYVLP